MKKKIIITTIIICIIGLLIFYAFSSDNFIIKNIEVENNVVSSAEELQEQCSGLIGENGFQALKGSFKNYLLFRYTQTEDRIIREFPYIEKIQVVYILPSTIKIILEERTACCAIENKGHLILVDKMGVALQTLDNLELEQNILIAKGLCFTGFVLGQKMEMNNYAALDILLEIKKILILIDTGENDMLINYIDYIDFSTPSNLVISLDGRITVNLGIIKSLDYEVKLLKSIYFSSLNNDKKGELNFSIETDPVFIPEK